MRGTGGITSGSLPCLVVLMMLLTTPLAAQYHIMPSLVDTSHVRAELRRLPLESEQQDIALGLLSFHDEQIEHLTRGHQAIIDWQGARSVPITGAVQRFHNVFNLDQTEVRHARLHMITQLSNQLFDDLRMVLPAHEQVITQLEQRSRRQRMMHATNFDNSPLGPESSFDALAWIEHATLDEVLREELLAATREAAAGLEGSLRAFEERQPDRVMRFTLAMNHLRHEHDPDARIRLGERLHEALREMRRDYERIAAGARSIADLTAGLLPPELAARFTLDRILATCRWLDGYLFEGDLLRVRQHADESLHKPLEALEARYLRAKERAARRLRDHCFRAAWNSDWIDATVASAPESVSQSINTASQPVWHEYRDASAFWIEEIVVFQAELARLAGRLLESSR